MSMGISGSTTYFRTSKAGLIADLGVIALALMVTAAQTANTWFAGSTATTIVLAALVATVPRGIKAKGTRLRAPVAQRRSGWICMGALILGLALVTITLMTGQPWWSFVVGLVFAVVAATSAVVIAIRQPRKDAPTT